MLDELSAREALESGTQAVEVSKSFETQARAPFQAAARLAADADARVATNARTLLAYGVEVALQPLMAMRPTDPTLRVQVLRAVAGAGAEMRSRTDAWLRKQLVDKQEIGTPAASERSPKPAPRRACDAAFMALRRLHHPDDDAIERAVDDAAYDAAPNTRKDEILQRAAESGAWRPDPEDLKP